MSFDKIKDFTNTIDNLDAESKFNLASVNN